MTVEDLMREQVVSTTPETPVNEVATDLRETDVGCAVVGEGNRPFGIVTDRDIAVRIAADNLDPTQMTAADVLTDDPTTVAIDTGVMDLCTTMCEAGIRRMPVVDSDELAGIITLDDLTVLLVAELSNLSGVIQAESPPY